MFTKASRGPCGKKVGVCSFYLVRGTIVLTRGVVFLGIVKVPSPEIIKNLSFLGPIRSYTVKENLIGSVIIKILQ